MATLNAWNVRVDETASAVFRFDKPIPSPPTRLLQRMEIAETKLSTVDPEEELLARLRVASQATRRNEARSRIEAKRRTTPVSDLLALLVRPEYRIEIDREDLQQILDSYPEDD